MLPTPYEKILDTACDHMMVVSGWTKAKQKALIKRSREMLAFKVSEGDSPRFALKAVFLFHSSEYDPGRADWLMGFAESKARELGVDLDDRAPFEGNVSARSLTIGSVTHDAVERIKSEFGQQ